MKQIWLLNVSEIVLLQFFLKFLNAELIDGLFFIYVNIFWMLVWFFSVQNFWEWDTCFL